MKTLSRLNVLDPWMRQQLLSISAGKKAKKTSSIVPVVLKSVEEKVLVNKQDLEEKADAVLSAWNEHHNVPEELINLLKKETIL
ncbi:methanol dehydrogenase type [Candidatus Scalindua japonica]|uniref:Methanol dehydrogenase type n=1 Tax=Candidatus Scalindua japonica TaxID=1284222 RepID=A0A286U2I4_9BACT|nr:methanol dehydrogenase type [Candidatus Scalindua japonica]